MSGSRDLGLIEFEPGDAGKTARKGEGLVQLRVDQLEMGMFVAALDRPWLETPFLVQGFFLRETRELQQLAVYCNHVWVDPRRNKRGGTSARELAVAPGSDARRRTRDIGEVVELQAPARQGFGMNREPQWRPDRYQDTRSMRDEFNAVRRDLDGFVDEVTREFARVRNGELPTLDNLIAVADPIVASVLRNKDALAALIRIKKKDDYTYSHSISTAVWASMLGRHLGLDRVLIRDLALGGLLLDVGKVMLPRELLAKPEKLSLSETELVRSHVEESVKIASAGGVSPQVLGIIAGHHERHDGSGYPSGFRGDDISLGARIAGLVDAYDAMITARPYAQARSSYEAMQELAKHSDAAFQGALVEQLIQAIGLFPTGALVELSHGPVAIVVAQNSSRRLRPKVVVVLDAQKQPLPEPQSIDLQEASRKALHIKRELPPGAFGINAEDYYL